MPVYFAIYPFIFQRKEYQAVKKKKIILGLVSFPSYTTATFERCEIFCFWLRVSDHKLYGEGGVVWRQNCAGNTSLIYRSWIFANPLEDMRPGYKVTIPPYSEYVCQESWTASESVRCHLSQEWPALCTKSLIAIWERGRGCVRVLTQLECWVKHLETPEKCHSFP